MSQTLDAFATQLQTRGGAARRNRLNYDSRGRGFLVSRMPQITFADRDRDERGNKIRIAERHQPGGKREAFMYYAGYGGPPRPPVDYDEQGNPQ